MQMNGVHAHCFLANLKPGVDSRNVGGFPGEGIELQSPTTSCSHVTDEEMRSVSDIDVPLIYMLVFAFSIFFEKHVDTGYVAVSLYLYCDSWVMAEICTPLNSLILVVVSCRFLSDAATPVGESL